MHAPFEQWRDGRPATRMHARAVGFRSPTLDWSSPVTRLTMLALVLITAALVGCNADWLTGAARPACPLVPVDSAYGTATNGDSVKAVLYLPEC